VGCARPFGPTNVAITGREEIFGPVVSVMTDDDEKETIAIGNDGVYGLSGAALAAEFEGATRKHGQRRCQ
jgi:aldehyde dehydrogenase (NAD+)